MKPTITWRELEADFPKVYDKDFYEFRELPKIILEESGIKLIPLWEIGSAAAFCNRGFSFESEKDKLAFILKYS